MVKNKKKKKINVVSKLLKDAKSPRKKEGDWDSPLPHIKICKTVPQSLPMQFILNSLCKLTILNYFKKPSSSRSHLSPGVA